MLHNTEHPLRRRFLPISTGSHESLPFALTEMYVHKFVTEINGHQRSSEDGPTYLNLTEDVYHPNVKDDGENDQQFSK